MTAFGTKPVTPTLTVTRSTGGAELHGGIVRLASPSTPAAPRPAAANGR